MNTHQKDPGFCKTVEMSLYLAFQVIKFECCLKKEKLIYYRTMEKEFNNTLNFDTIIPSMMKNDKVTELLLNENQLNYIASTI